MSRKAGKSKVEQADGRSGTGFHAMLKRKKKRAERRKAKADPEAQPTYGKYNGYET